MNTIERMHRRHPISRIHSIHRCISFFSISYPDKNIKRNRAFILGLPPIQLQFKRSRRNVNNLCWPVAKNIYQTDGHKMVTETHIQDAAHGLQAPRARPWAQCPGHRALGPRPVGPSAPGPGPRATSPRPQARGISTETRCA